VKLSGVTSAELGRFRPRPILSMTLRHRWCGQQKKGGDHWG
jgi:hypothetical protein